MKKSGMAAPWPFFILVFAWSWFFWILTVLWCPDATHFITQLGFALGGLGPMVFGIYFTYREGGRKALRDYGSRVLDWKRLGLRGWLLALGAVPALTLLAGWKSALGVGSGSHLDLTTPRFFTHLMPLPLALPAFLGFMLLFGPIPEELGWRGYALDRLRARWGSLGASLILGFLWGLWHLPLFFLKGAYQANLDFEGSLLFFAGILPLSIVMTWIYDLTGKSILSAILFHFSVNLTGTLVAHDNSVEFGRVLLCWVWVLAVAFHWRRPGRMKRGSEIKKPRSR